MSGDRLLKMFDAIMRDVDNGSVDKDVVEDFREVLSDIDVKIENLQQTLDETTDALANYNADENDLDDSEIGLD